MCRLARTMSASRISAASAVSSSVPSFFTSAGLLIVSRYMSLTSFQKQLPDSSVIRAALQKQNEQVVKKTAGACAPAACLGWPDSNRRVKESKSFALPLGDSPKCLFSIADCFSSDKPLFAPGLSPLRVLRGSRARGVPREPVRSRSSHDKNRRRPPRPRPDPSRCPRCTPPPPG